MGISAVSLSTPASPTEAPAPPQAAESGPAGGLFGRLLQQAAQSHESADAGVRQLALGQTDNLHGVLLQMAQADLSFHLVLEVRNRLTEAYQEIMKMQM